MNWSFTTEVETYLEQVVALLTDAPDEHTATLSVIDDARARTVHADPTELFGWWTDHRGQVTGGVCLTPPHQPLLEVAPEEAIRPLVEDLTAMGHVPTGVTGPTPLAVSFAAHAAGHLGLTARLDHAMTLYRVEVLARPNPLPPGHARLVVDADAALLREWAVAFAAETATPEIDAIDAAARQQLATSGYQVWEAPDGTVVSLAGRTQPAWGVARIGPVYTPPDVRGHGYAAAVTYTVTSALLDQGVRAVLFTDLASPAPNALYQRLGYQAMAQWASLVLE